MKNVTTILTNVGLDVVVQDAAPDAIAPGADLGIDYLGVPDALG